MALRICRECGKEALTIEDLNKFKKDKTSKHGRENLCQKCHSLRYWPPEKAREYNKKWRERNPDYMKNWLKTHPDYMKNKLEKLYNFKGKLMYPEENPRSNICSECGRSYPEDLKSQTCMHHIIYDETNPLAWTVELCKSCHTKLHRGLSAHMQKLP